MTNSAIDSIPLNIFNEYQEKLNKEKELFKNMCILIQGNYRLKILMETLFHFYQIQPKKMDCFSNG